MERHEALQDLSRDHHHVLARAQELQRAGTEEGRFEPEEAARRFLVFWEDEAALHFREEEDVLLPIYQRRKAILDDGNVREMLADHAWFRDEVPKLREALEAGDDVTDRVHAIGRRLHDHARLEEREIFEDVQEVLSDDDLDDLLERGRAFREEHRPDAIGPR